MTQIEDLTASKQANIRAEFEKHFVRNGGDLTYIHWDECDNGAGNYMVNWELFGFNRSLLENDKIYKYARTVDNAYYKYIETQTVS